LAGTSDGIVVLFKNGVLQAWYQVDVLRDLDVTVMQTEDEMPKHNDETGLSRSTKIVRKCFTSLYGLFLVVGDSVIYYFEKMDEGRRSVSLGCCFTAFLSVLLREKRNERQE